MLLKRCQEVLNSCALQTEAWIKASGWRMPRIRACAKMRMSSRVVLIMPSMRFDAAFGEFRVDGVSCLRHCDS